MKILNTINKIILTLILVSPIGGVLGLFPEPTRELYHTDIAFEFVNLIMNHAAYISHLMAIVFVLALVALWTKREVLASLLILPITLNIIGFHLFLDGGLFNSGSIMAIVLFILNMYFLFRNREYIQELCQYKTIR